MFSKHSLVNTPTNVDPNLLPSSPATIPAHQRLLLWLLSLFWRISGWLGYRKNPRVTQPASSPAASIGPDDDTTVHTTPSVTHTVSPSIPLPSQENAVTLPSSASIQWQQIDQKTLETFLTTKEGFRMLTKLTGSDATSVVDFLDKMLDSESVTDLQGKRHLALQRKLCGNCGIIPTSCRLTEGLEKIGDLPHSGGAFSEVWEGRLNGKNVAIKALRIHTIEEPAKLTKRICKEVVIWKRLSHPNVLRFIGVANAPSQFSLVSPWMHLGNITDYTKKNTQVNVLPLLRNVADGLFYLHSRDIVHGDLKGSNVLIDDNKQACIADYVLTTIVSDLTPEQTMPSFGSGISQWLAPELFAPTEFGLEQSTPSKESDIYALGMVIYEVMTGSLPFGNVRQTEVSSKVIAGIRPELPTDLKVPVALVNAVWPIAQECWCQQQNKRLTIAQVSERLTSSVE